MPGAPTSAPITENGAEPSMIDDSNATDLAPELPTPDAGAPTADTDKPLDQDGPAGLADPAEPDAGLSEDETRNFEQNASVINQFFGGVSAEGSTFGGAGAVSARRTTGLITATRIAELLRGHVPPPRQDPAVRTLLTKHLLVIAGTEGIGKRQGGLAVLATVLGPDRPVASLPPSKTLADLAGSKFQAHRGYLVQDWNGDRSSAALQQFDVDQLRRALDKPDGGAYLVLTCQLSQAERRLLDDVIVDWMAPAPLDVFDARLGPAGTTLDPDEDARLRERISGLHRPRDVVAVAERAGQGVDGAFAVLGEADRRQVAEWFEGAPAPRSLLSTAALCFLDGSPDQLFQSLLNRLVVLVNEHATVDSVTRSATASAPDGAFPRQDAGSSTLETIMLDRGGDNDQDGGGNRVRTFASPHFREHTIAELVSGYGFELWEPMRAWIDEVAGLPPSSVQVRLAFGVALLARHAPDLVERRFLEQWANGLAAQRLTAAYVLSWMCLDDALAGMALRIAQRWTSGAGARRAATAAMAFAGELGVRYQSEALNKLWHLTLRVAAVSNSAATALSVLLWSAVDDAATAKTVLKFLRSALRALIDDAVGVPANGDYFRQVDKALSAIRRMLCGRSAGAGESVTATILRTLPNCMGLLGELWAEVLRSARHRNLAVEELCQVLAAARDDADGLRLIAEFGTSIRSHLSPEENRLLRRQVAVAWERHGKPPSGVQVTELLKALSPTGR